MFTLFASAALQAASPAAAIEGAWTNPGKSVIIAIAPCSDALCGTVRWATAQAQQDARKGTPQLIGTQLLTDLKPKDDKWQGRLFVPDQDLRVSAKLELQGQGELKVSGCELGICKSQVWTRAEGPLPAAQ